MLVLLQLTLSFYLVVATSFSLKIHYCAVSNLNCQRAKTVEMEVEQNNETRETSSRLLLNNTTARSIERTTTQNLPCPILENNE